MIPKSFRLVYLPLALLASACAVKMWVPVGDLSPRPPRSAASVVLLDGEPTDRPFVVIGLIVPPPDEYDSYAEIIAAARAEAGRRGADAMFIVSETDKTGWSVGRFGGGTTNSTEVKIKAIVWQP